MKISFAGYPQHATRPTDLPPALFAEMKAYALGLSGAIIATQIPKNLISLTVEGHADFDAQGRAFELKVSQERADNCKALLVAEVANNLQAAFTESSHLKRLAIAAIGWGTARPVVPTPATESDREANRRVEVTFAIGAPMPPIDDSAHRALAALESQGDSARMRRLRCMLAKLRDDPAVVDSFPDFEAGHRVPGSGGFPTLSPNQWATAIDSFVVHVKSQVASVMAGGTLDDQRSALLGIEDNIGRNVFNWTTQLNAGSGTGLFDRVVIAFIQNQMANPSAVLACYAGYSRMNPDL